MNKPSKKTEWNWEEKFDKLGLIWFDSNGMDKVKYFIRILLHQRDNEIREKIRGMKKRLTIIKVNDPYGNWHNTKPNILDYSEKVHKSLDDLLTYLSNRKEEV